MQADVVLVLKDFAIRPFHPYFEKSARIDVQSGAVNFDGALHLELVAAIPVPDSDLRLLARQRAEQMRGQLAGDGTLADERVFLTEVDLTASDHEKKGEKSVEYSGWSISRGYPLHLI